MLMSTQPQKSLYCRRGKTRRRWNPGSVAVWSQGRKPVRASAIEVDEAGARLLLPRNFKIGDSLSVSVADEVGHFQSYEARVVWTHSLKLSQKVIAGVVFLGEVSSMARESACAGSSGSSPSSARSWSLCAA